MDRLSRHARQRRAHFSRRRGNRSAFFEIESPRERTDRCRFFCGALRACLAIRAVRPRLVLAPIADRRNRALDHFSCGGLRRDDRRRLQRHRDGQNDSRGLFHY